MDAGNQVWVLYKSSKHSQPLGHFSNPWQHFSSVFSSEVEVWSSSDDWNLTDWKTTSDIKSWSYESRIWTFSVSDCNFLCWLCKLFFFKINSPKPYKEEEACISLPLFCRPAARVTCWQCIHLMYVIVTREGRGSKSVLVLPSLETYCAPRKCVRIWRVIAISLSCLPSRRFCCSGGSTLPWLYYEICFREANDIKTML